MAKSRESKMKLKEWLKARKERREARRRQKVERSLPLYEKELQSLDPIDPDTPIPESRFTDEYREFLNSREETEAAKDRSSEES